MANIQSAKKRARQIKVRQVRNHSYMTRIRTFLRRAEEAIASGVKANAKAALKDVQPQLHIGVNKGLLHKNTAARKLSRLSVRVKKLA
jgi:small subunit ribosomal protein S20